MTEPRDLDPRLREALRATDQDRHDADRIVDAILDGTASSRVDRPPTSGDRRPRWMAPLRLSGRLVFWIELAKANLAPRPAASLLARVAAAQSLPLQVCG